MVDVVEHAAADLAAVEVASVDAEVALAAVEVEALAVAVAVASAEVEAEDSVVVVVAGSAVVVASAGAAANRHVQRVLYKVIQLHDFNTSTPCDCFTPFHSLSPHCFLSLMHPSLMPLPMLGTDP